MKSQPEKSLNQCFAHTIIKHVAFSPVIYGVQNDEKLVTLPLCGNKKLRKGKYPRLKKCKVFESPQLSS